MSQLPIKTGDTLFLTAALNDLGLGAYSLLEVLHLGENANRIRVRGPDKEYTLEPHHLRFVELRTRLVPNSILHTTKPWEIQLQVDPTSERPVEFQPAQTHTGNLDGEVLNYDMDDPVMNVHIARGLFRWWLDKPEYFGKVYHSFRNGNLGWRQGTESIPSGKTIVVLEIDRASSWATIAIT